MYYILCTIIWSNHNYIILEVRDGLPGAYASLFGLRASSLCFFILPFGCVAYCSRSCVRTDSLYLFVAEVPTSTSQLDQAYSVNLYPNPTSGPLNLNIQGIKGDLQAKLWSIEGKMVQSLVVEGCQIDCLQSIDINNQVRGIYLLQIQSGELSIWRRVLLKWKEKQRRWKNAGRKSLRLPSERKNKKSWFFHLTFSDVVE